MQFETATGRFYVLQRLQPERVDLLERNILIIGQTASDRLALLTDLLTHAIRQGSRGMSIVALAASRQACKALAQHGVPESHIYRGFNERVLCAITDTALHRRYARRVSRTNMLPTLVVLDDCIDERALESKALRAVVANAFAIRAALLVSMPPVQALLRFWRKDTDLCFALPDIAFERQRDVFDPFFSAYDSCADLRAAMTTLRNFNANSDARRYIVADLHKKGDPIDKGLYWYQVPSVAPPPAAPPCGTGNLAPHPPPRPKACSPPSPSSRAPPSPLSSSLPPPLPPPPPPPPPSLLDSVPPAGSATRKRRRRRKRGGRKHRSRRKKARTDTASQQPQHHQ
jgi:hypothetical protein